MTAILEVDGLEKRFGGVHALRGASLSIAAGEIVGLFGPNGAGKTTLFNLIAGTFPPDRGNIRLRGESVTRLPAWRRARKGIGRTFQITRPFRDLTTLENVLATVPRTGATKPADAAASRALLRQVGLDSRAGDLAGTLTLGMLKRLEVARALALQPYLLLIDEPLAGLSGRESADLLAFIATLRSETAVIMVEHNVRQSLPICDRAIVLDAGTVIAEGTPQDIRTNPAVIRAYLGTDAC